MKTVILPITITEDGKTFIYRVQKQFSSAVRIAYNRFYDNYKEKDVRAYIKGCKNVELLNSALLEGAIDEGYKLYVKDSEEDIRTLFGGRNNFNLRCSNKISKEEFQKERLLPLYSVGRKGSKGAKHGGNNLFIFHIEEDYITFRYRLHQEIIIHLPKLKSKLKKELLLVEQLCQAKEIAVTVRLEQERIHLIYDEQLLHKEKYKGSDKVVGSVDLNPSNIGFSISKFHKGEQEVLYKEVIDISKFTKRLGLPSTHKLSKQQVNKRKHELVEICKYIVKKCKYYGVGKFAIEDLQFKENMESSALNRLCKNCWNKNLIVLKMQSLCGLSNIKFVKVNPAYSSFVGNLTFNEPDMVASSLEIARRCNYLYIKGKFYPSLIKVEDLKNRWKKDLGWTYESWVELYKIVVKVEKLKYHNSLEDYSFKVLRFNSDRSKVKIYSLYR